LFKGKKLDITTGSLPLKKTNIKKQLNRS